MAQTVLNVGNFNSVDLIKYLQNVSETEGPETKVLVQGDEISISKLLAELQFEPENVDLVGLLGQTITIDPEQAHQTVNNLVSASAKIGVDIDDMMEQMQELNFLLSKAQKAERNAQRDIQSQQDAAKVAEMRKAAADRFMGAELQAGLQIAGGVLGLLGAASSAWQLTKMKGSQTEIDELITKLDDPVESKSLSAMEKKIGYAEKDLRTAGEGVEAANKDVTAAEQKLKDAETDAAKAKKEAEADLTDPNLSVMQRAKLRDGTAVKEAAAADEALEAAKKGLADSKQALKDAEKARDHFDNEAAKAWADLGVAKSQLYTQLGQALQSIMGAGGSAANATYDYDASEHDARSQEAQSSSDRAKSKAEDFEDARREFRDAAKDLIASLKESQQMQNDTALNIIRHV